MPALRDALRDLTEDVFFDLLESDEAYLLVLDVPGITADSLGWTVEDGRLSITGQRAKAVPDDYHYLEENRSLFLDVDLPLPDEVRAADVEANAVVERGVLELTLPKSEPGSEETTIDIIETKTAGDENGDIASEGDAGTTANRTSDTGIDADTDTDIDTNTDTDADTNTDTDADTDTNSR
ncbi:Hsp20/alpha crystallin family protein [Natrialba sp. PRR66]|uniref:Hsp20/alpha crystallin family protein n=1 Tax=Natrialba sp. PRR66 TaxID=3098146 RepID=UPI002B1D4AD2|nr:Hsp20/alpha crystallin family protein [Natrialba sp. PRR66]